MSQPRIRSFEEFWPYYVRAHAHKGNRMIHFAGTTAAVTCAAAAVLSSKLRLLALAPVVGYGAAWIGHFFIEGNRPATFGHPLWSLKADFVMWSKIATGTMDAEVERFASSGDGAPAETADDFARVNVASSKTPDRHAIN